MSAFDDREINAFELKFEPGPRITEADKKNDRKYRVLMCLLHFF